MLAKCRPKFISVATWGARFQGCSTPFTRFNLCENCYRLSETRAPRLCETRTPRLCATSTLPGCARRPRSQLGQGVHAGATPALPGCARRPRSQVVRDARAPSLCEDPGARGRDAHAPRLCVIYARRSSITAAAHFSPLIIAAFRLLASVNSPAKYSPGRPLRLSGRRG